MKYPFPTFSLNAPRTRYCFVTTRQACFIICGVALLIVYGLMSLDQVFPVRESSETDGEDARMYQSVIERVHAGENYYDVVGEELRGRGYASRPFFNWRLPTIAWTIGQFPSQEWGKWLLIMLALLAMVLWFQVLDREEGFVFAVAGTMLFCGPLLLCFSEQGFYYHELWAGVLISFSLAARARGYIATSILVGSLAVLVRELALLYLLMMLILAWKEQQQGETLGWLGGLTVFSVALTWHASIVSSLLSSIDQVNESWIQFGGWPFVLSTGNWNAFLLAAPQWVVAIAIPLALLGLTGRRGTEGLRSSLTLVAYCSAYLIAGRMNNAYWGMMYAPLVSLGFLYALPSMFDLTKVILSRTNTVES